MRVHVEIDEKINVTGWLVLATGNRPEDPHVAHPSLRTGKAFCAGGDLAVVSAPTIAANAPLSVRASKRIAYRSASCGSEWEDDVWQLNSRECRDVFT
ncbi:MAG: hypothetical protein ACRDSE_24950, partial [Pseudonocardiaceae bacterium]